MIEKHAIGISEYRIASEPEILITYGLGSCIAITLYDPQSRIGGMAHTLLPRLRPGMDASRPAKFVDAAIELMLAELVRQGADASQLQAKLIGGATMFDSSLLGDKEGVGLRNTRAARQTLERCGIRLIGEDVGGSFGRTVEFHLVSGEVSVRSIHGEEQVHTF